MRCIGTAAICNLPAGPGICLQPCKLCRACDNAVCSDAVRQSAAVPVHKAQRRGSACVSWGDATSAGTVPAAYRNFSSVDINITSMVSPSSVLLPFGAASGPEAEQLADSMKLLGYEVRAPGVCQGHGASLMLLRCADDAKRSTTIALTSRS